MSSHPEFLDTLPAPGGAVRDPTSAVPIGAVRDPHSAVPIGVMDDSAMFLDSLPNKIQQPLILSSETLPYQTWDRYQIVAFLGAGGMGTVYKAQDHRLNRSVAIKFLRCNQADAFAKRQRRHFEREAKAQASIEHPNICKIYEGCWNSDGIGYVCRGFDPGFDPALRRRGYSCSAAWTWLAETRTFLLLAREEAVHEDGALVPAGAQLLFRRAFDQAADAKDLRFHL